MIAITEASGQVPILLGNGDGTFTQAAPIAVGTSYGIVAADFNGDGSANVTVLSGNGDGTFTQLSGSPVLVGKGAFSIAVGDFNGSGRLGLAVANLTDSAVSVLLQH